ncbi:S1 family peptidase [Maricaulis maris]|jgi:Trypsin-like peptidase domain|uniref:S1 family peptidase n=1 Tax=Maricaulis maris TaxID=74318 RepID=UPI002920475F|nr:hypothetical protein MACH15_05550 [Maricaulis maris]
MTLSPTDQLVYTTVKITTRSANGSGSGTGFFFRFCESDEHHIPAIVTNKHVIEGAVDGEISLCVRDKESDTPKIGTFHTVQIPDFEKLWIKHPENNVDLAVLPLAPLLKFLEKDSITPFFIAFSKQVLADDKFLAQLQALEDIVMIGYPIGLWDSVNNMPIIRRGCTATPPFIDFNGEPLFLIDCACFPGSSGSPVLLFNTSGYMDKSGNTSLGGIRVKLLGVLFAGPQFTAKGEIKVQPVPTNNIPIAESKIPINLGYCVKATQLDWFEEYFRAEGSFP